MAKKLKIKLIEEDKTPKELYTLMKVELKISYETLLKKIKDPSLFKVKEAKVICSILNIKGKEIEEIFFN